MPNYTKPTMKKRPVKKGTTTKRAMKKTADARMSKQTAKPSPTKRKHRDPGADDRMKKFESSLRKAMAKKK